MICTGVHILQLVCFTSEAWLAAVATRVVVPSTLLMPMTDVPETGTRERIPVSETRVMQYGTSFFLVPDRTCSIQCYNLVVT